jgi:hypothetical protein
MNSFYWVVLILVLLLTVYTGAQAIPLLVLLYTPRLLKFWFIEPTESERWISASPTVQEKIGQLHDLGFVPLGIKAEKILWQKPVYEVALTNPEKEAFASIMLTHDNQVMGVYLFTPMSGGAIIFTRGRSRMPEIELSDASVKNTINGDLKSMLTSHSQRIRAFKQKGIAPLAVNDQAARIAATYHFYESTFMKQARRNLPRLLPVINFPLAIVLLIAVLLTYILRLAAG